MSGKVKALVSADQPLILIYGGDGEYAEIQFETPGRRKRGGRAVR